MAGEWVDTTLGSVVDFLSGGTPSKKRGDFWGGSIPWVSAKDMKRFRLDDTQDHVTETGVANGTKLIPRGTVLLLVRGMTLLNDVPICVARRPMAFNQDVKALRPMPDIHDEFLPYLLLGNKARLLSLVDLAGHGTGRLNSDELKAFEILLPPFSEQRAIAHILGMLDDKIELNRQTNETLESMARTLFKSWFVDFDPIRAKVEGRNPELPTPLAELFPGSFEDSELGRIPRGWEVKPIRELIGLSRESIAPGDHAYEVFDHYSIPAYDQGGMPHPELGSAIRSNKYIVFCDSVLLSKLNPRFPRVWLPMLSEARRSICSTEFLVVRPKFPWTREFVYSLLRSDRFISEFSSLVTGTSGSHQRVRPQAFLSLPVVCPQLKIAEALDSLVSNWLHRGAQARSESRRLAALRDTLLPKLISGELRVKNAERFSEERPSAGY